MTQVWIAVLIAAGIVLVADLLTTHLRRRARRTTLSAKPLTTGRETHGPTEGKSTVKTE
jgi:hypothetical protein